MSAQLFNEVKMHKFTKTNIKSNWRDYDSEKKIFTPKLERSLKVQRVEPLTTKTKITYMWDSFLKPFTS